MVNGKLGQALLIGFLALMPLEKFVFSGLGPGDLFFILFVGTAWITIWRERMAVHFPLALPMWIIFVASLVGALSGLDIIAAGEALLQEIYLYVIFITLINAIVDKKALYWLGNAWAWVAAIESLLLILDRVGFSVPIIGGGGAKAAALGVQGGGAVGRAVGTFVNANAAGGYMLLTFFVILALPVPRNRLLRFGFLALYILGLLATGSVGALVGLSIGLLVAVLYWLYRSGRPLLFWLGLGLLLVTILMTVLPLVSPMLGSQESLAFQISLVSRKIEKRFNLWSTDAELMAEHPLGIGPNVTASVVIIGAHSDYVAFMTERGPVGFIGLFLLLGEVIFWVALSARDGRNRLDHLATGALLGAILGLMAMATVHETNHGRPVWMMFAVVYLHYKFIRAEARERVSDSVGWAKPRLAGLRQRFAK